jgi:hypothetical protein
MTTTRANILKNTNQEEAFKLIEEHPDWNQKRKNAEKTCWKAKHAPETINRNPAKGNRGGKLNIENKSVLDMTIEEFQELKQKQLESQVKAMEEMEEKIKKGEEQVEKWKKDLEELKKIINK